MKIDVYSKTGQVSGKVELPDSIFNVEPHEHAMYLAVRTYLSNQRQGTHKTKGRSEVSGGGKKPWKQKGRGTARSGSSRSPVWVGGGTIFGPKPHTYKLDLPKKVKRLARKSALSTRVRENNLIVVEDLAFSEIKTKQMAEVLKALKLTDEKVLHLMPADSANTLMSCRNIEKLTTEVADRVSTYHILSNKKILVQKSAVDVLVKTFSSEA
jgi:large subunit ribosomal protein L4